ncbi:pilus assembly protein TadG-related protein [Chloroflexota bacterium]
MRIKNLPPRNPRKNKKIGESGQAIIIIIFTFIGLLGASALAIDGTSAYIDSRRTDTAASAAALTAALTRIEGGNWRAAALATAAANGYDNNGVTNTVELNTPPLSGPYAKDSEYIEVIITSHMPTYFGRVIGIPSLTSVSNVVSQSKPSELGEMFPGYALISLAPKSECDRRISFWIHSEATLSLVGGGLFVNSKNSKCAFISFGGGSVRVMDNSRITVVGGADIHNPRLITPYPIETNMAPIPYPLPYKLPRGGCGEKIATYDELTGTLTSGTWEEGVFPPEGVTQIDSGIYCFQDDVSIEGTLQGDGVTFIIEDGNFKVGGNAEIDLSAPKGGIFEGLLIYMPPNNNGIIALNGNDNSRYVGTILAPAGDVRINGMNNIRGAAYHSQIIGYYVEVDGTDNIEINYKDEQNWDTLSMPEVVLIK